MNHKLYSECGSSRFLNIGWMLWGSFLKGWLNQMTDYWYWEGGEKVSCERYENNSKFDVLLNAFLKASSSSPAGNKTIKSQNSRTARKNGKSDWTFARDHLSINRKQISLRSTKNSPSLSCLNWWIENSRWESRAFIFACSQFVQDDYVWIKDPLGQWSAQLKN